MNTRSVSPPEMFSEAFLRLAPRGFSTFYSALGIKRKKSLREARVKARAREYVEHVESAERERRREFASSREIGSKGSKGSHSEGSPEEGSMEP